MEKEKMEASENIAGGYMVQDHCRDKNKVLSWSVLLFLWCWETVFHGSLSLLLLFNVPQIQSIVSFFRIVFS